jgi:hypothetical protein
MKNAQTYRDLDYNKVVEYADKKALNTETTEHWKEAAQMMFAKLKKNKSLQREFENHFHTTAEATPEDFEQWLIETRIPTLDIEGMEFEE